MTVPGMPVIYYGEEFGKAGEARQVPGYRRVITIEFIREPMSWYKTLSLSGDKKTAWNIDPVASNAANAGLALPCMASVGQRTRCIPS